MGDLVKTIVPGDVFLLPLKKKYFVTAKIIWVSKVYNSAIGYVLLPKVFKNENDIVIEEGVYKTIETYAGNEIIFYCYGSNIRKGVWPVIGKLPLNSFDDKLIYHEIGGNLYKGDHFVKKLEQDEYQQYHSYLLGGNQAVLNTVDDAFENEIVDTELAVDKIIDPSEIAEAKIKGSYP